ncbi:hypothetical protein BJF85_17895 [Saccharomonospora sp. CUA-673]|nr:hypothetical protein BJF85_17895 [Saccharomonospora sp. CUA-673]
MVPATSLRVRRGEVVAVAGPSGCGKSTLLRAVLDALPQGLVRTAGTVSWQGSTVGQGTAARRWRRRVVGFLGQDPATALHPALPVHRLVSEGPGSPDHTTIRTTLELLGLDADALWRRRPHQLSGGQAQRVALARAVAGRPGLLILDEPTSALDCATLDLVVDLLTVLRSETATIVVSHDREFTDRITDHVLVLGEIGRAASNGPAPTTAAPARNRPRSAVLSARGLTVPGHGSRTASAPLLEDVSLALHAGELTAVLGESGCGKTTLLRALAGLHPYEGGLDLKGTPLPARLDARTREQLRAVQLISQSPADALNPAYRVGTTVARAARLAHGLPRAAARTRAREVLAAVGLSGSDRLLPRELSGGQRQRAAIARALVAEPAVLLADEVTSALDTATAHELLDLLDRLRADGLAVLLVTHDRDVAARADRTLRLHQRRLDDSHTDGPDRSEDALAR